MTLPKAAAIAAITPVRTSDTMRRNRWNVGSRSALICSTAAGDSPESHARASNLARAAHSYLWAHSYEQTQERIDDPRVLNVIGAATSPQGFYRTMSDHLPVTLTLDASGPDDD